jgi:hypothetical protein
MKKDPWPFPADTAVERARRIAQSYRHALMSFDADLCRQLDEKAVELGQGWVRPLETDLADLDEALTAEQIGAILGVSPRTVRMWGYRGHIERLDDDGKPRFRFRDVLDYLARTRQKRSA